MGRSSSSFGAGLLLLVFLGGCGGNSATGPVPPPGQTPSIALSQVVIGLDHPVGFEIPDDGSGRIFIVQQTGAIRIVKNGSLVAAPFLDISGKVNFDNGEQGLLGLVFHPNYSQHPLFYVNYTRSTGGGLQTVIAEYQLTSADQANAASERILLTVNQPFSNHKGGELAFGPDGFLYIALGDGGSAGDPLGNGQSLQTLLGKILRIDVDQKDTGLEYKIPGDNPFIGTGRGEIYAYGFRNPWRFSFERGGSRLFVADVGQDKYEEIDLADKGKNYGWNIMEGAHCFSPSSGCNETGLTLPIAEYDHSEGEVVIGGYVYHGSAIAGLAGTYLLADFSNGKIWGLSESAGTWKRTLLLTSGRAITSFGQDTSGELYVVDYSGSVLKITP